MCITLVIYQESTALTFINVYFPRTVYLLVYYDSLYYINRKWFEMETVREYCAARSGLLNKI